MKIISAHDTKIAQLDCSCCSDNEHIIITKTKNWDPIWDPEDYCFTFEFIDKDEYKSLWQRIKRAVWYLKTKEGNQQNSVMVEIRELKEFYKLLYEESKTFLDPSQYLLINEPVPPKIRKEYGNWKPNDMPPKMYDAYLFETVDFAFGFFGDEREGLSADQMDIDTFIFDFKKEKYSWERQQIWGWLRWGYKSGIEHHEICINKYQLINLLAAMSWCIKSHREDAKDKYGPKYIQLEIL